MEDINTEENTEFNEEWLYCLRANEIGEAVELLKQRLVTDLDVVDNNGNGALHYCCANNLPEAIVFLLEECKVDYCRRNHSGNTPLQWAVQTNSLDAVKEILRHDYVVHKAEYESQEVSTYYANMEGTTLRDEYKLDEETKRHYNIMDYPDKYSDNNIVSIVETNDFGKSALNDAFNAKDQNILVAILEHPAAAVLDKPAEVDNEMPLERVMVNGINGVIHSFRFGKMLHDVRARELEIKHDEVLNEKNAELDHSGEVIWETDLIASQWLSALARGGKFQGKKVLQLGSGCGLSAITMYVTATECDGRPQSLMLTDVCNTTMANLRYNVELNKLQGVDIQPLDWTKESTWPKDQSGNLQSFDIVIGSDLVYDSHLVQPLCNVIMHLMDQTEGELLYVYREARDGSNIVPDSLRKLGLTVETRKAPKEYQHNPLKGGNKKVLDAFFPDLAADDYTILHAHRK
ncbi:ankyrin repeat containing protein [Babesia ovis]|uniref:Ankyrin repeat containing protein n=1 Tax=Babesia ovis TaxID=5869 RepID=A0A9W5WVQ1_BABOV|nr:ankyrin repeat containing protein [Babesia ovis]